MLLIERAREVKKIPKDIAVNCPLRENLLSLFISIYSHTPLFICGKPGSSKTISVNIIKNIFNTNHVSEKNAQLTCFKYFKSIRLVYYQGSIQSTDQGIERVFVDAQSRMKNNSTEIPLVFFDEIELAELSPSNPLKILHKYLEYSMDDKKQQTKMNRLLGIKPISNLSQSRGSVNSDNMMQTSQLDPISESSSDLTVPFVGISNWTIDVSKMNRNIYLSRPNPEFFDLYETAKTIFKYEIENLNSKNLTSYMISEFSALTADIYHEFRLTQFKLFSHKNFHSLRDFYWLLKNIGKKLSKNIKNKDNQKILELILKSIHKNFSGYYCFSKRSGRETKVYSSKGRNIIWGLG